jgi:hypothetical protein
MSMENYGGMISTGETKELGDRTIPVPLCPQQILHGLTRVSVVRSRKLPESWHRRRLEDNTNWFLKKYGGKMQIVFILIRIGIVGLMNAVMNHLSAFSLLRTLQSSYPGADHTACGADTTYYTVGTKGMFPWVICPEREVETSAPPSAKVKNARNVTSSPAIGFMICFIRTWTFTLLIRTKQTRLVL